MLGPALGGSSMLFYSFLQHSYGISVRIFIFLLRNKDHGSNGALILKEIIIWGKEKKPYLSQDSR